jgi:hypothetical protein
MKWQCPHPSFSFYEQETSSKIIFVIFKKLLLSKDIEWHMNKISNKKGSNNGKQLNDIAKISLIKSFISFILLADENFKIPTTQHTTQGKRRIKENLKSDTIHVDRWEEREREEWEWGCKDLNLEVLKSKNYTISRHHNQFSISYSTLTTK